MAAMQWSSEIFDFSMIKVPVKWGPAEQSDSKAILGRYEYKFSEIGGSDR